MKATCEVMQLEPDLNLTKSIPSPVIPELVLPYTDEECAPLPPEEFSESEEDVDDLTNADDGDESIGKKAGDEGTVAEDAVQIPKNVEGAAEAEAEVAADVAAEDVPQV